MKLTRSKFNEMIPDEIDALYEEQFIKNFDSKYQKRHNKELYWVTQSGSWSGSIKSYNTGNYRR